MYCTVNKLWRFFIYFLFSVLWDGVAEDSGVTKLKSQGLIECPGLDPVRVTSQIDHHTAVGMNGFIEGATHQAFT